MNLPAPETEGPVVYALGEIHPAQGRELAPGAYADMLLVDGDPVADLEVLTRQDALHLIIRNGEVVVDKLVR